MKLQRSVLVLIIVPAVVSLLVTLLVLYIRDARQPPQSVVVLPTHSGTALVAPRSTQPPPATGDQGPAQPGETADTETLSATIPPGCENITHTVASGEVLGAIADSYGVSVDDLAAINLMLDPEFDPDFLSVDQQIVIPLCGVPSPTPSPTPTHTLVPTRIIPPPIATVTEAPPGMVSVSIARILNVGDVTSEVVEIVNQGTPVEMEGWKLTNGRGAEFVFPPFRLFSGGSVRVHTGVGENQPIDLYWGLTSAAWRVGDLASLFDAEGNLLYEFVVKGE